MLWYVNSTAQYWWFTNYGVELWPGNFGRDKFQGRTLNRVCVQECAFQALSGIICTHYLLVRKTKYKEWPSSVEKFAHRNPYFFIQNSVANDLKGKRNSLYNNEQQGRPRIMVIINDDVGWMFIKSVCRIWMVWMRVGRKQWKLKERQAGGGRVVYRDERKNPDEHPISLAHWLDGCRWNLLGATEFIRVKLASSSYSDSKLSKGTHQYRVCHLWWQRIMPWLPPKKKDTMY